MVHHKVSPDVGLCLRQSTHFLDLCGCVCTAPAAPPVAPPPCSLVAGYSIIIPDIELLYLVAAGGSSSGPKMQSHVFTWII